MTNNNTPTEPGWYYRDETSTEDQMVYVAGVSDGKAFYIQVNRDGLLSDSAESPKWLGPVPMPGEFVSCEVCGAVSSSEELWERTGPGNNDFESVLVWKCRNGHETRSEATP